MKTTSVHMEKGKNMELIDKDVLLERFAELEATALDVCERYMHDEDQTMWKMWSIILTERTSYKYDVLDAPTVDAVPVIRCGACLKKRICLLYRETNDENGFCAWGARMDDHGTD